MNIIFTHLLIKKTVLYTTRINLEKRIFHIRTSILLKIGGPLQLVVVLVLYFFRHNIMNLENYLFRYIMFYHIQKIYPTIHQSIQLYVQQARVDSVTDRCTRCFPNYLPCHMSLWTVDISSITARGPVLTRISST